MESAVHPKENEERVNGVKWFLHSLRRVGNLKWSCVNWKNVSCMGSLPGKYNWTFSSSLKIQVCWLYKVVVMPPTTNQVARRRAVRWRKRKGRREPLLVSGTRKRGAGASRGLLNTRHWVSCLGCTSRHLYEPLGDVPVHPVSKFRFDAIRPAMLYR